MENEIFLDDLVMEVVDLGILRRYPQESSAEAFLKRIGYAQKYEYILDTINQKLPVSALPEGLLFVLTPDEGFVYRKRNGIVIGLDSSREVPYGDSNLREIMQWIDDLARKNRKSGTTTITALFYNEKSRLGEEQKPGFSGLMEAQGFTLLGITGLKIIEGRGQINYYSYRN